MHFGLSDDQRALQREVGRFFAAVAPKARAGDADAWTSLTRLGWQAIAIDGEAGGAGGGVVDLSVVLTEAGRTVLALPLLSTAGLAAPFLGSAGADALPFLARIVGGEGATLAFHGADELGLEPGRGVRVADGLLSGTRALVTDLGVAGFVVVPFEDAGTWGLAIVERSEVSAGGDGPGMDPSRRLSCVSFDSAAVAAMLPLDLDRATAAALTALAAELVGVADAALAQAIAHAVQREQFGQRIGSFQAIKHKLADTYVLVERARSLVYAAAMFCDDAETAAAVRAPAASMAKAAAGEAALFATSTNVQVHAAIAVTAEHTALDLFRRARQATALLGDHLAHHERAGRSFLAEVAVGHP